MTIIFYFVWSYSETKKALNQTGKILHILTHTQCKNYEVLLT